VVAGRLLSGFSRLFTHFLQVVLNVSALKHLAMHNSII
jgi:hypothetical protein